MTTTIIRTFEINNDGSYRIPSDNLLNPDKYYHPKAEAIFKQVMEKIVKDKKRRGIKGSYLAVRGQR